MTFFTNAAKPAYVATGTSTPATPYESAGKKPTTPTYEAAGKKDNKRK